MLYAPNANKKARNQTGTFFIALVLCMVSKPGSVTKVSDLQVHHSLSLFRIVRVMERDKSGKHDLLLVSYGW